MTGIERLVDIVNDGPYSGGMVHISVQKLREICEQIEREQDAAVKDSPCDAILTEDREAIAWVRAYGGMEKVKQDALCWNTAENIAQTTLDWLARVCPVAGIEKFGYGVSLEKLEDAINRRLMPEGIEWPRFEDGELVGFGDEYVNTKGNVSTLRTIVIKDCRDRLGGGYYWKLGRGGCAVMVKNGERIKRPPVLAADGKPLEAGQTVWEADGTGHPFKVVSIRTSAGRAMEPTVVTCDVGDGTSEHFLPSDLTHQRPVLGADGVPIKMGDTVWRTSDAREFEVTGIDGAFAIRVRDESMEIGVWTTPCGFTHTKPEPDSWSSVWADVSNGNETPEGMMRRCRALAERGE